MLGDIQLSEPGALIAFAGRRVVQATVKNYLQFLNRKFLLKHGFVDRIVREKSWNGNRFTIINIAKQNSRVDLENNEQSQKTLNRLQAAS